LKLLRNRYLLPLSLMVIVGIGGLFTFSAGAGASSTSTGGADPNPNAGLGPGLSSGGGVNAGNFNQGTTLPFPLSSPCSLGGPKNSGFPNSSARNYSCTKAGVPKGKPSKALSYGDSDITYKEPPASYINAGEQLFAENCSSCHGNEGGGSAIAPPLIGVGPATVDFWVSSGRMPATTPNSVEAERKPAKLSPKQALQVAAYLNSLDPSVPFIPYPNLKGANLADGADLFSLNCAACHTITGAGDALAFGTNAPSLNNKHVTAQQVAEAIRTGPANMPRFTGNLSDAQVRDVVAYVTEKIQHASDPGGFALGGVGPVAEGFVALLIGVGALVLVCYWIGDRS
jgi:ubiquinol-cytochrome c reductase cytochrome c subunit